MSRSDLVDNVHDILPFTFRLCRVCFCSRSPRIEFESNRNNI